MDTYPEFKQMKDKLDSISLKIDGLCELLTAALAKHRAGGVDGCGCSERGPETP